MAEQRVKEIGVRKVLGASVFTLWGLLSKDFVELVALSLLLAFPLAGLFYAQLAAALYIPDWHWLVDLYGCRPGGFADHARGRELSIIEGSPYEPGKMPSGRVT